MNHYTLYKQLLRDAEPLYEIIKRELSPPQLAALIRLVTQFNLRGVPIRIQEELVNLGLIVYENAGFQLFSSIFEEFLQEDTSATVEPKEESAYRVSQDEAPSATLKVWEQRRAVQTGDKLEFLSPNEWKLFAYLWKHANNTCTREDLLQAMSSEDADFSVAALDITISRLRQKIELEPDKPRFILTVRGRGYRLEVENIVHS